jgi:hypothetical protein
MRTELYDRITPANVCDRMVAVGDETCSVEDARQMIVVDVSAMTEREIDWMETMGVLPDGHRFDTLPDLIVDAYRYRTLVATVEMCGDVLCPVCELAHGKTTIIDDWMVADLVEWNVMGDPRPYVLICPECSDD